MMNKGRPKEAEGRIPRTVVFRPEIDEAIKRRAQLETRNFSQMVEHAFKYYVAHVPEDDFSGIKGGAKNKSWLGSKVTFVRMNVSQVL